MRTRSDIEATNDSRNIDRRALRFRPRGLSWLPGYLARATVAAHAADVGDKCYIGYFARRIDRHGWGGLQQGLHATGFHRRVLFNHQRRRWLCDYGSDAADV